MKSRNEKNIKGIDISNWQANINFNLVKKDGIEVAIIKASEGVSFLDKRLNEHYEGAKKAGLKIGFYHFMSDKSDPKEQARDFWKAIKDKTFHVFPVLDIEKETTGRSKEEVTDRCLDFLEEFKKISGHNCMVYTYTYFAQSKLDKRLKKYLLWIAHYGVKTPGYNGIWDDWAGFQYTDKGNVAGVTGNCDCNEFTEEIFISRNDKPSKPTKPQVSSKKELWQESISGEIVKDLQRELNKTYGNKLTVDGYFGEKTLNACVTISKWARGPLVKIIQKRLVSKGFSVGNIGSDGIFGEDTLKGVKNFQRNKKLVVDGIVGKNTWKALFKK